MNFFLTPPVIDPAEHLSPLDAQKTAAVRLNSPPSAWPDEVVQNLIREHPYIPPDRVVVNFKKKDDAQGTAFGYIGVAGAPHISIPVIIRRRELAPLDVLVRRADNDAGTDQGIGDMTEDKVLPLTEETFEQALDTGSIGEPISDQKTQGTGYTEDGSALRLPFRSRTVMASVLGATPAKLEEFIRELSLNKEAQAGFAINGGSEAVVDSWLSASPPTNSVINKIANQQIKRASIRVLTELPHEVKSADFNAGVIFMASGSTKTAAAFDAIDLANPSRGLSRYFVYEDATYGRAPEKIATIENSESESLIKDIFTKCSTGALRRNMVVSFAMPGDDSGPVLSAPAKIAGIVINEQDNTIQVRMLNDMLGSYNVLISPVVKTAFLDPASATWVLPSDCQVLAFSDFNEEPPMALEKIAQIIANDLRDELVCSGRQFTLTVNGDALVSLCNEQKVSAVLDHWFENGSMLLDLVKEAAANNGGTGSVRFNSDINETTNEIAKLASGFTIYPELARKAVEQIGIPMKLAVKLAAAIGNPDGVDAILGAGFLTEDNLAEFVSLGEEFDDTVSKLARLLLAIRMGLPGDESATMVAMKSLQRVAERLKSAVQETGI